MAERTMWTPTSYLSAILVLSVVSYVFGTDRCVLQPIPPRSHPPRRYFNLNGFESLTVSRVFYIMPFTGSKSKGTECFVDIQDIFIKDVNNTDPKIRVYGFGCMQPMTIHITGSHSTHREIVSFVELHGCNFGIDSLSNIANITSLTVVNIIGQSTLLSSADPSDCSALNGIGTLMISNRRYPSLNMEVFYACKNHLSFMAEMILSNLSLSSLPSNLDKYMPTLQGLDLTRNNFTTPPVFPWDNSTRNLPHNLSRTVLLQNHYTYGTVNIPDNEYRREYRLDDNPHLNLTGYTFRGYLQILSLARCGLESLQSDEFYEVEGLQYLSLKDNRLKELPKGLFLRSSELRILELQGNKLRDLKPSGFEGLKSLNRLNLANNELTSLQDGVFDGMTELKKIDLSGNKIKEISSGAFSELLVNLKVVILANNSLTYMPEGLLMLRGLYDIKLQGNNITDLNFTRLDQNLPVQKFVSTIVDTASSANPDIDIPADGLRRVDMSGCNIKTMSFSPGNKYSVVKMAVLLKHFKFVLENNDLVCDCNILNLTNYVREIILNGTIRSDIVSLTLYATEYPFYGWKCAEPNELAEKNIFSLKDEETYCQSMTADCPHNCTCYKRSVIGTNIVDCRGVGLSASPDILPAGDTELWLQDNHISNFKIKKNLSKQLVELHLEKNGLETLEASGIFHMRKLKRLYIHNNLLAYIPSEIRKLDLEVVRFGGNPLQCDCHALWMKKWLLKHFDIVADYSQVKCVNNVDDTGTKILKVDDEDFVCDQEIPVIKIIVSIAVPTVTVLIMLILSLLLFIFWNDFKVFLYVHTGIHPFDKKDPGGMMYYDVFVVYSSRLSDWAHEHIIYYLRLTSKYKVYDVANDFKFGFSLQDNIQHGIKHSRRMVLIITQDSKTDSLMQLAIAAGLEKCRNEKANFLVPVLCNTSPKDIENVQLQKYFKAKKFITNSSCHFIKRLLYHMPTTPLAITPTGKVFEGDNGIIPCDGRSVDEINILVSPSRQPDLVEGATKGSTVFVWYADADFQFMMDTIVNPFEAEGHKFILSDKSFIPGASIQENILHAIEDSDKTIIILSKESLVDEWTLYAFRFATERQMLDKCFLTGLVVREGLMDSPCDEEIVKHLLAYQPLSEKDGDFQRKMRTFMLHTQLHSVRDTSLVNS